MRLSLCKRFHSYLTSHLQTKYICIWRPKIPKMLCNIHLSDIMRYIGRGAHLQLHVYLDLSNICKIELVYRYVIFCLAQCAAVYRSYIASMLGRYLIGQSYGQTKGWVKKVIIMYYLLMYMYMYIHIKEYSLFDRALSVNHITRS